LKIWIELELSCFFQKVWCWPLLASFPSITEFLWDFWVCGLTSSKKLFPKFPWTGWSELWDDRHKRKSQNTGKFKKRTDARLTIWERLDRVHLSHWIQLITRHNLERFWAKVLQIPIWLRLGIARKLWIHTWSINDICASIRSPWFIQLYQF
jgi:hypothetical protein